MAVFRVSGFLFKDLQSVSHTYDMYGAHIRSPFPAVHMYARLLFCSSFLFYFFVQHLTITFRHIVKNAICSFLMTTVLKKRNSLAGSLLLGVWVCVLSFFFVNTFAPTEVECKVQLKQKLLWRTVLMQDVRPCPQKETKRNTFYTLQTETWWERECVCAFWRTQFMVNLMSLAFIGRH